MAADEMSVSHGNIKPSIKMTLEHFPSRPAPEMILRNPDPDAAAPANTSSISLFSPWQALYSNVNPFFTPQAAGGQGAGQGNPTVFPFPSPSLGFTIGDNFVPWPDLGVFSGFSGMTPGAGGMPNGSTSNVTGFPFPQPTHSSDQNRKDSLQSLNNERHAVSRFDSASSGVSSSAISVALQTSTTPESGSLHSEQQMATPMQQAQQQAPNHVQASDFNQMQQQQQQQQHQGFAMDYARMQPQMNIMPPTYHDLSQQQFTQSAVDAGWSQFRTFSNYNPQFASSATSQSAGQQNMEAPLISRSSSTSNQQSSISPAMLSNMVSRMPSQTSAFYNQAEEDNQLEEDDVLIAVASSAAPSEYGGATLSSRNPSPEAPKKSRKRPASGPQGQRGGVPNGDNDALLGSEGGSGEDDDVEGDPEPEGVERNGMMWGMKTEEYKALSARERKRVRNRISARTFRARRKEHLTVLESDLADRNTMLKAFQEEIRRLREENTELQRRLSKYEPAG